MVKLYFPQFDWNYTAMVNAKEYAKSVATQSALKMNLWIKYGWQAEEQWPNWGYYRPTLGEGYSHYETLKYTPAEEYKELCGGVESNMFTPITYPYGDTEGVEHRLWVDPDFFDSSTVIDYLGMGNMTSYEIGTSFAGYSMNPMSLLHLIKSYGVTNGMGYQNIDGSQMSFTDIKSLLEFTKSYLTGKKGRVLFDKPSLEEEAYSEEAFTVPPEKVVEFTPITYEVLYNIGVFIDTGSLRFMKEHFSYPLAGPNYYAISTHVGDYEVIETTWNSSTNTWDKTVTTKPKRFWERTYKPGYNVYNDTDFPTEIVGYLADPNTPSVENDMRRLYLGLAKVQEFVFRRSWDDTSSDSKSFNPLTGEDANRKMEVQVDDVLVALELLLAEVDKRIAEQNSYTDLAADTPIGKILFRYDYLEGLLETEIAQLDEMYMTFRIANFRGQNRLEDEDLMTSPEQFETMTNNLPDWYKYFYVVYEPVSVNLTVEHYNILGYVPNWEALRNTSYQKMGKVLQSCMRTEYGAPKAKRNWLSTIVQILAVIVLAIVPGGQGAAAIVAHGIAVTAAVVSLFANLTSNLKFMEFARVLGYLSLAFGGLGALQSKAAGSGTSIMGLSPMVIIRTLMLPVLSVGKDIYNNVMKKRLAGEAAENNALAKQVDELTEELDNAEAYKTAYYNSESHHIDGRFTYAYEIDYTYKYL